MLVPYTKALILTAFLLPSVLANSSELPMVTAEFPPFSYMESGKLTGASVEVVETILTQIGYTPKYIFETWTRSQWMIEAGKAAGVFTYTQNATRLKAAYYTNPISSVRDVFFKRKEDDITWNNYSDLANIRVGGSSGYNYWKGFLSAAKDNVFKSYFIVGKNPEKQNLGKLMLGRIDVLICEISSCNFLIKRHKPDFESINYIDKEIGPERSFHVGFSKKWPESKKIRDEFNLYFDKLLASGEVLRIYNKYGVKANFNILGYKGAHLLDKANE